MAKLLIFRGETPYKQIDLADRDLRIGRGDQNDIILEDPTKGVSRIHAELRYEGGQYVLLDLNSQNGIWMSGQRVARAALEPGLAVMVGPYRLVLEKAQPAIAAVGSAAMPETIVGAARESTQSVGRETMLVAPRPPLPTPATARSARRPAKSQAAAAQAAGGPVGWLARQPKPLVFGVFAVFMIVLVGLKVMLTPAPEDATQATTTVTTPQEPAPPAPPNEEVIARHIADGRALIDRGDYDAARQEFDAVLLIDRTHAEANELKVKADDLARAKQHQAEQETIAPAESATSPGSTGASTPPAATPPASSTDTSGASAKPTPPPKAAPATAPRGAAPPKPEDGGVTLQPGEKPVSWRARMAQMQARYDQGKANLSRGELVGAAGEFEAIVREEPRYRDAAALLAQVRNTLRQSAQQAFDGATKLENEGDLTAALDEYARARRIDASIGGVDEATRRVRDKMNKEGDEAYRRAKQYDALGRTPEAIALYERAVKFLSDNNPNRKPAQDRLSALRASPR